MRFLVTGTAGFVGFHLARRLLVDGHEVAGVDVLTPYYDLALKRRRHAILADHPGFQTYEFALEDATALLDLFRRFRPEVVVHLAGQAGVRYSLENPRAYVEANVVGTFNLIEACRAHPPRHLLFASTSSAYGGNTAMPFREIDRAVLPLTIYAASKIACEAMAHSYAHLWAIPTTAFRFFTVYGPWGRPDMAPHKFTDAILKGQPIELYNHGESERDFTYIDDLIESIVRLVDCVPRSSTADPGRPICDGDTLSPVAPYRLVNIGGGKPATLASFVAAIEAATGRKAEYVYKPLPAGDVERTAADSGLLRALTGFVPSTPIEVGIPAFVDWFRDYYGVV